MGQGYSVNKNLPYATCVPGSSDDHVLLHSKYSERMITSADGYKVSRTLFEEACKKFGDKKFLGTRPISPEGNPGDYEWKSFNEVYNIVENFSSGLEAIDACPLRHFDDEKLTPDVRCLGVSSRNREEYLVAIQSCYRQNYALVPLYDTLGNDTVDYIVNQTDIKTVVAEEKKVKDILQVASKCPSLKQIISLGSSIPQDVQDLAKENHITLYTYQEVIQKGINAPSPKRQVTEEDVNTICYTSGTTGTPKGVVLTHKNFSATVKAFDDVLRRNDIHLDNEDCHICYLPFAHIFERAVTEIMIMNAVKIGFYTGDSQKIVDDVKALQPTIFFSVPRLFNRIYEKITDQISKASLVKQLLFKFALQTKLNNLKKTGDPTYRFLDKRIFNTFKQALGGKVRILFSGSAPMNPQVIDFLKVLFCCPFLEGYGMTETVCAGCITYYNDCDSGIVGGVIGSIECKIRSIEDMNYSIHDKDEHGNPTPRGELCIRGDSVFGGYFRAPEKTKEVLKDGWFHTGDVCKLMPNGALKIIDRAKNIFKLAQGEYVAPEKIEGVYNQCPAVSQSFVFGYSTRRFLVAVIVPNWDEYVKDWCQKYGVVFDKTELCENADLKKEIMSQMKEGSKKSGLCSFEQAKEITIVEDLFTIENDLLTPSFKLKRHVAKDRFKKLIDKMYSDLHDTE